MCDHHRRRLITGSLSGLGLMALTPAQVLAAPTQVYRLEGDAWLNGKPLDFDSVIKPGDLITTGDNSLLVFSLERDVFMLRSNGRLQLEGERGVLDILRLWAGGLLSVFEHGRRRTLHTPVATAGIRGTGAYLEMEGENLYFCNCYGEIQLDGENGGSELIQSSYHGARTVSRGEDGRTRIETDVFRGHNNWELAFLESRVGRETGLIKP